MIYYISGIVALLSKEMLFTWYRARVNQFGEFVMPQSATVRKGTHALFPVSALFCIQSPSPQKQSLLLHTFAFLMELLS